MLYIIGVFRRTALWAMLLTVLGGNFYGQSEVTLYAGYIWIRLFAFRFDTLIRL